jgi:hypothetical protein
VPKAKLTKSQRRRANERRRKESALRWQQEMGPPPAPTKGIAGLGSNLDGFDLPPHQREPWEKAPAHLVDKTCEQPSLKDDALKHMSRRAGDSRTQKRFLEISELKLKYQGSWGKRSGAKVIASFESEHGNPISERTLQKYFKLAP